MKKFLFLITLFSFQAHAGLGWLLLGAAMSESSNKTPVESVKKTDLQVFVDNISSSLPSLCNKNLTTYSRCWNKYSEKSKAYKIAPSSRVEELTAFFLNQGYRVTSDGSDLVFDFTEEHEKYVQHNEKLISLESVLSFVPFVLLGCFMGIISVRRVKYVKEVERAYHVSKENLHFFDKGDRKIFEDGLLERRLPSCWSVKMEGGKIKRINYQSAYRVGIVATDKDKYIQTIRGVASSLRK